MNSPLLITLPQAAQLYGVSTRTIRRLMERDPDFPRPIRLHPSGPLRFHVELIDADIRRRAEEAA